MNAIHWTDDGAASVLGWAVRRISSLLPSSKRSAGRSADAGDLNFYTTSFRAPLKRRADFRRAVELALPQLMPVAPEDLLIYARRIAEGVELAAFRKEEMEGWSRTGAGRPGASIRVSDAWSILPPSTENVAARRRLSFLTAAAVSIIAIVSFHFMYLSSLDRQLSGLLAEEQRVRSAALIVARQREEADLWGSLESAQASARLPATVLAAMAELSRTTPADAAWTRIEWSPSRTTIAGTAADPVAVLAALSSIKGVKAEFSKPMTGSGLGRREFEILITYGGAPK